MSVGRSDDEAEEQRRRAEEAEQNALTLSLVLEIETLWDVLLGEIRPVTTERQFEAVVTRAAELVEATAVAVNVHPSERPLRPLLERCPEIIGSWRLDTEALTMSLRSARVVLPTLSLPGGTGDAPDALELQVDLHQPPYHEEPADQLTVIATGEEGATFGKVEPVIAPLLAAAARDHLTDALATATVLSRTSTDVDSRMFGDSAYDTDADSARTTDRLVDLFAGFEHVLARRDVAGREPDGTSPVDAEVKNRRKKLFAESESISVDVRQSLPEGTLEPERLTVEGITGEDPDGYGMRPVSYRLSLDLRDRRRGEGILRVENPSGRAERAVLLPRTTLLWIDHIDSALRRANIVVPAVQRSFFDEMEHPIEAVEPPVGDSLERILRMLAELPYW